MRWPLPSKTIARGFLVLRGHDLFNLPRARVIVEGQRDVRGLALSNRTGESRSRIWLNERIVHPYGRRALNFIVVRSAP